jgi:hypothetical protein
MEALLALHGVRVEEPLERILARFNAVASDLRSSSEAKGLTVRTVLVILLCAFLVLVVLDIPWCSGLAVPRQARRQ